MKKSNVRQFSRFMFYLILGFSSVETLLSQTDFRKFEKNQTYTYPELIKAYGELDKSHSNARLLQMGMTDAGKPLPVFVITQTKNYIADLKNEKKVNILINNGIHPGEPDGIDASLWLAKEILERNSFLLKKINLVIIAIYNVDGSLNRSCCSRANQNGPEEYGFRGNARNLDLNRDFIKADSRNARSFSAIFHWVKPPVFVDTHVSNGSDYQYTFTLITTQLDKLGGTMAEFCRKEMQPHLFRQMEKRNYPIVPYVNTIGETPENGIEDFNETPRFATGYTALFNTIGFTTETHMFKPYKERVTATHHFLEELILYCADNAEKIIEAKIAADKSTSSWKKNKKFDYNFEPDTSYFEWLDFKGYEAEYPIDELTGKTQLFYNRERPFTRKVKYFNRFKPTDSLIIPYAFVIPYAWGEVLERLRMNEIKLHRFTKNVSINCDVYYIRDHSTGKNPYEGHYLHNNTTTEETQQTISFNENDHVVLMNQPGNRFILEVLEPKAVDSYFNWNFFDAILQQKEWFSSYVFIEKAKKILDSDNELKNEFEMKKRTDKKFEEDPFAQLLFIYRKSPFYEISHNRYPIYRIRDEMTLPIVIEKLKKR